MYKYLMFGIIVSIITFLLKYLSYKNDSLPLCVCRNHLNEPVDWFIIYKLPRLSHSIDPLISNGTGYFYLDSSSSLDQWHLAKQGIDSLLSLPGLTLQPLYQYSNYSYIFYNDQPPNIPISMIYGHSKGVLAFEDNSQTGFWLIHSVPRFPQIVQFGYEYPDSGRIYGQTMLCLTINSSSSIPYNTIDYLTNHFLYTRPLVFDTNVTSFAADRYSMLFDGIIKNKAHINDPPYSYFSQMNSTVFPIYTFGKYGLANIDMLSELIVPSLKSSMFSETWSNGRQKNLPSDCSNLYHTENIESLKFNFTVHQDHSKWLISQNDSWVCIGDMNRQFEQKVRHGGFACIYNEQIQNRFKQLVSKIESCPIKKFSVLS